MGACLNLCGQHCSRNWVGHSCHDCQLAALHKMLRVTFAVHGRGVRLGPRCSAVPVTWLR
jgi:hypothetical protein